MANRCAGLQTIRPHLPAPAPTRTAHTTSSSWLAVAAFDNEALTSTSPANVSELLSGGHRAPATALQMGTKAGRVTKRKPRPSTRRQTPAVTYVTAADPADFRRMVQEITGASSSGARQQAATTVSEAAAASASAAPPASMLLPMLDTSAFLLDRAVAPREPEGNKSSSGYCASPAMTAAVDDDDEDEPSVLQAQSFVSDFPTLESCWGIK